MSPSENKSRTRMLAAPEKVQGAAAVVSATGLDVGIHATPQGLAAEGDGPNRNSWYVPSARMGLAKAGRAETAKVPRTFSATFFIVSLGRAKRMFVLLTGYYAGKAPSS